MVDILGLATALRAATTIIKFVFVFVFVLTVSMVIGEPKMAMLELVGGRSEDTEEPHFGVHGTGHAISFE
jgi:hypothetical protein